MNKQKLITIAKEQLEGGIAEDQVRELLVYRGISSAEADEIMREVLATGDAKPAAISSDAVLKKADEVFGGIAEEVQLQPEDAKKERHIIILSVLAFIFVIAVGSAIYYFYF